MIIGFSETIDSPSYLGYHLTLDYYEKPFLYNNIILFIKVRNDMLL